MSIPMNSLCVQCFFNRRFNQIHDLGTQEQGVEICRRILSIFANYPGPVTSAALSELVDKEICTYFGLDPDRMKEEKQLSNHFVMERLETIRQKIRGQKDPVFAALQFAILGNYLDFSALQGQISFEELEKMLDGALEMELDPDIYRQFCADLEKGRSLLYITDNAGEIAFDRLMAEALQENFPHLEITFLVRGGPVSNDATREDAVEVGIDFPVLDSGASIGGTLIERLSPEAKKALDRADVILAKGMGNTESMLGCGYNVYYGFLVKCARFMQVFEKPKMTPMFIREKGKC